MLITKVALISGGARRIGAAIVTALHAAGFNVVVHYHQSQADAEALVQRLLSLRPDSACCFAADLNAHSDIHQLAEAAQRQWGRLDVLINNASRFYPAPLAQATEHAWDDLFNSNVKGAYFLAQATVPFLQAVHGCMINIADIHGELPLRDHSVYCMAKAALVMMTKSLAKELAPNIRVNAVAPGAILWPEAENALCPARKAKIIEKTALKRAGSPNDIAEAVLYLIQRADYVSGQVLRVGGGRS